MSAGLAAGCGGSSDAGVQRSLQGGVEEVMVPQIAAGHSAPADAKSEAQGAARVVRTGSIRPSRSRRASMWAAISILPPKVTGGVVPNAAAVTEAMTLDLRRCLVEGAAAGGRPGLGEIMIAAELGGQGEVVSASAVWAQGVPRGAIACIVARVGSARFDPPQLGGATVLIAADTEIY